MNCILCNCLFNEENSSFEHIIPSAIGGKVRVPGILCKKCNNESGHRWDCELAEQLNPLSLLLTIKRQSGSVPSQDFETVGGEPLRLNPDGVWSLAKPKFVKSTTTDGTKQISFQARTIGEAKQMLEGVKRNNPQLSVSGCLANLETKSVFPTTPIKMSLGVGGPMAGRAIVKSALCLAVSTGVNKNHCAEALQYLHTEDAIACFGWYYETDVIGNRQVGIPLHCVAVSSRQSHGQLLGYVEYYGAYRVVVCLANEYAGPDIHSSMAIDPVSGDTLSVKFDLPFTRQDIQSVYRYDKALLGSMERAVKEVLCVAYAKISARDRERAIDEALTYGFENCGAKKDEIITDEQWNTMFRLTMQKLGPYLLRHIRRPGRSPIT